MNPKEFYTTHSLDAQLKHPQPTTSTPSCAKCKLRYAWCSCSLEPWQEEFRLYFYPEEFCLPDEWWTKAPYKR